MAGLDGLEGAEAASVDLPVAAVAGEFTAQFHEVAEVGAEAGLGNDHGEEVVASELGTAKEFGELRLEAFGGLVEGR